jgi:hypothetical protein
MRSVGPKGRGLDGPDNLAEGAYREGKERHKHYRIARGSAAEVCAVLDLLEFPEGRKRQQQLRRVVAMSCRLR